LVSTYKYTQSHNPEDHYQQHREIVIIIIIPSYIKMRQDTKLPSCKFGAVNEVQYLGNPNLMSTCSTVFFKRTERAKHGLILEEEDDDDDDVPLHTSYSDSCQYQT
jgi:hypothetical protein